MRIWFDTEFYEDGRVIELISIGMVREDGATLYLETTDAEWVAGASEWLRENVKPHLKGHSCVVAKDVMAHRIREFAGPNPEFWAYYASYDWVVLCQIFGTMMQLPRGWPMFVRDVQQWRDELSNPDMPTQENEHDALADALWTKAAWEHLHNIRKLITNINKSRM